MKLYESYTLNVRIDIQNGGSHENLYLAVFIDVKPATFHGSINIPSTTELVYFSGSTRTILPVDRSSGHAFHKVNIIPLFMGKVYISISAKNICIASDLYQSPDTHRPVSLAATNWFVHQQVELSIS